MMLHSPRIRRSLRVAASGAGLFLLAACGGGADAGETDISVAAEDVDQEQSATITEKELASFQAPADSSLTPRQVEAYIKTIGLFNTKAKSVIAAARILVDEHQGEVPRDRAALETLPGVGRKTANVVLNVAYGEPTIAVDTGAPRLAPR